MEGRARTEGVAASIHESYMDAHGNKVAEDTVFKTPCVVIIFDEAPRYREVQSKPESKHPIMKAYRDRASSQAETREEFLRAKHVFFRKLPLRSGSLFASTKKVHRPRS